MFFLPAAAHTEKDGSFTNTQRMLQWHHKAVEPPGDARSDLWFTYHLGRRIREKLAGSTDEMDRPLLDLTWDYPVEGELDEPDAEAVLPRSTAGTPTATPLSAYTELKADGSTACGCWIYCGVYADGVNQAARRKPGREQNWVAPEWGWAWPANRRILYNRASADPDGKPWSERKALVWWDAEQGKWTGHDVPDFVADQAAATTGRPTDATGAGGPLRHRPVHHAGRRQGLAVRPGRADRRAAARALRAAGVAVRATCSTGQQRNPARQVIVRHPDNRFQPSGDEPGSDVFPYVATTYRLTEHHTAGGMWRFLPYLAELQPEFFCEVSPRAGRRARAGAPGLGHDRHRAQRDRGAGAGHRADGAADGARAGPLHQIGLPYHWGPNGLHHRRRGQRAAHLSPGPERAHPGGQGDDLRHPPGPAAARAGAARARARLPAAGRDHRADGDGAVR